MAIGQKLTPLAECSVHALQVPGVWGTPQQAKVGPHFHCLRPPSLFLFFTVCSQIFKEVCPWQSHCSKRINCFLELFRMLENDIIPGRPFYRLPREAINIRFLIK